MTATAQPILTQILGISQRDHQGAQALVYAPAPLLQDDLPPEILWQRINAEVLRRQLQDIRGQVEDLIWRARLGKAREGAGIEARADVLASHVLPEQGFAAVVSPGIHPRLDIAYDAASEIPWEILEETYARCDCQPGILRIVPRGQSKKPLHCEACGRPMVEQGGKLGIDRHLTHLVRGGKLPTAAGSEFLIIEDPTEDLCADEVDPQGHCKAHLSELKALLERAGYRLNLIRHKNATTRRVLAALENPAVVGLYYFGHGLYARREDHGCLLLADGPLYAAELQDLSPGLRFAFLNACEGGAAGGDWTLEKKFRSVGYALARGGPARTVIAPLWPVVNVQAAAMAMALFREALAGKCLGEAVRQARLKSLQRYEAGEADISWMAYRYFGDPNRSLPPPKDAREVSVGVAAAYQCRLFAESGRLDLELFAFGIRDVLFRAAKRRNLHDRASVTPADIFAGLVRTGQLTRFVFSQQGVDPDDLYDRIVKEREAGSPCDESKEGDSQAGPHPGDAADPHHAKLLELQRVLSQWIVRRKEQFSQEALTVLEKADQAAQSRTQGQEDPRISEQLLLESLMHEGRWTFELKTELPAAEATRQQLARPELRASVDENGCLVLTPLSPAARRIVETAHELAQQRGICPIPNRLLLAAFMNQPTGHAASVCRYHKVNAKNLARLMIAATEGKSPETFALSPASAARVLLPTLQRAAQLRRGSGRKEIDEAILFRAYCQIAPAKFKELLSGLPSGLRADLDLLGSTELPRSVSEAPSAAAADSPEDETPRGRPSDPARRASPAAPDVGTRSHQNRELAADRFEEPAQRVLAAAAQLAMIQGYREVRSVHLFAALGWFGTGLVAGTLRQRGAQPEEVCLAMLRVILPRGLDAPLPPELHLGPNAARIVTKAAQLAQSEGRPAVGERDLCRALLADRQGAVARTLTALRCGWLLDEPLESPAPETDTSPPPGVLPVLGVDLTELARAGTLFKAADRHREVGALVRTLGAQEKSHALLVGEPGVGKTTVARAVADWIVEGLSPDALRDKRVIELSGRALAAMAPHQAEYTRRFERLLADAGEDSILLIGEIDLLAAGAFSGLWHRNANRLLKAALAESRVRVVGTASTSDYQKWIAADSNLAALLQVQVIEPPLLDAALEMVSAHREDLELEYHVAVSPDAVSEAVRLTKDAAGRGWPGKAMSLLERACDTAAATAADARNDEPRVSAGVVDAPLLRSLVAEIGTQETGILKR